MFYRSHPLYRLKIVAIYLLVKLKLIHRVLPKKLRDELPIGWNDRMFWLAFKSAGKQLYMNFYSELKQPKSYSPKATVNSKYQLTKEQIKFFFDNGYLGPLDLMSSEEAGQMKDHVIGLDRTESTILSYSRGDYQFEDEIKNGDSKVLRETNKFFASRFNSYDRHLEDSMLLQLFKKPEITERCAQILGPDLLLWHSNFFETLPHSNGTPWHQTNTWLNMDGKDSILQPPNVEDIFALTCWVALNDVPKERACLKVIPGSHERIYPIKFNTNQEKSSSANKTYGSLGAEVNYPFDSANVHFLEARAGQFFIFCERVLHGSTKNVTDDYRWAIAARIVRPDTKIYTKKMLQEGYDLKVYGAKKIKLDTWKAVLIRGEDRFCYNKK